MTYQKQIRNFFSQFYFKCRN